MAMKDANEMLFEEIERILECEGRPTMLPKVTPAYDNNYSVYPDQIRVSFSDGHTEIYDRRVVQPAPQLVASVKIIRKWKEGYVNKPQQRRRNRK